LQLLKSRLTAKDDFSLEAFLAHCQQREASLPSTHEDLVTLKTVLDERRAAIRVAMSPWSVSGLIGGIIIRMLDKY
jgi:hypothetical protein